MSKRSRHPILIELTKTELYIIMRDLERLMCSSVEEGDPRAVMLHNLHTKLFAAAHDQKTLEVR